MASPVETPLQRMELLIGEDNIIKLKQASVLIVGVGGVGSYAAEALARSGIGKLILVDGDTVAPSNLNRQIHATFATIGQSKTKVMKKRIESYRNDCEVITQDLFYNATKNEEVFKEPVDFVVDAIDTMSSKLALIQYCLQHNIPFISSMGMANRMDRSLLIVKVKIKAVSNMTGERTKGRIPLEMAVCKMVTSLVKRVIKELVEKWSVFAKENS